jgi:calcineurin-like phosphoesterase family protein
MNNTWIISDTHFNDSRIITATKENGSLIRPGFDNVNQHDDYIIDCWNSVVKPNDTVWHLGDVLAGDNQVEWMENNWHRLNGNKNIVLGNHDKVKLLVQYQYFDEVVVWKILHKKKLLLTHVPVQEKNCFIYPSKGIDNQNKNPTPLLNVHGHIHENPSPPGPYKCVCVEQINYIPVNIDELKL